MNNYSHILVINTTSKSISFATIFGMLFIRVVLFKKITNSPHSHIPIKNLYIKLVFFFILTLTACTEQKPTLNIAVASNFEPTLKRIIQQYQKNKDNQVKINIISGSSGVLANQVINNAPYDIFLSADIKKTEYIHQQKPSLNDPHIYAIGQLALWIPHLENTKRCIDQLSKIDTVVIANPKTAPYGSVAAIIMDKHNIKVNKLVHAANISQSYLYTQDKFAQAGFVAYSMLKGNIHGCQQVFTHRALSQSMILLDDKGKDVYDFILSKEIQLLIKDSGYNIHNY